MRKWFESESFPTELKVISDWLVSNKFYYGWFTVGLKCFKWVLLNQFNFIERLSSFIDFISLKLQNLNNAGDKLNVMTTSYNEQKYKNLRCLCPTYSSVQKS